jgi:hypothetical protein
LSLPSSTPTVTGDGNSAWCIQFTFTGTPLVDVAPKYTIEPVHLDASVTRIADKYSNARERDAGRLKQLPSLLAVVGREEEVQSDFMVLDN